MEILEKWCQGCLEGCFHLLIYINLEDIISLHGQSKATLERFLDGLVLWHNQKTHVINITDDLHFYSPCKILDGCSGYAMLRQVHWQHHMITQKGCDRMLANQSKQPYEAGKGQWGKDQSELELEEEWNTCTLRLWWRKNLTLIRVKLHQD